MGTEDLPPPVVVRNEFSLVEVSYVRDGESVGVVITDPDTGGQVTLSPAELASLARCSHEALRALLRAIDDHHDDPA